MLQELITKTNLAKAGEEIGLELGNQMVKTHQEENPTDVKWYLIGREIIEKILNQPGCVAMRFYNATNEVGQKTLVYVGVDREGNSIIEYSTINLEGVLESQKGIVADRVVLPSTNGGGGPRGGNTLEDEPTWWTND